MNSVDLQPKKHHAVSGLNRLALEPTHADAKQLPDPTQPLPRLVHETVFSRFLGHAQTKPDEVAIDWSGGSTTYGELEAVSRRLAQALQTRGIGNGHVVGVLSSRSPALVAALLAVLRSGATFFVMDAAYPAQRLAKYVSQLKPALLLRCGVDVPAEVTTVLGSTAVLDVPETAAAAFASLPVTEVELGAVDPDVDAYVMFTSGSTGEPKSVVTSHSPLVHFIQWHAQQHQLGADDRFSMLSGLGHDPVLRDIFTPLSIGATLCIPEQETIFNPSRLAVWFHERRISVCHLTPAMGEIICAGVEGAGAVGRLGSSLDHMRHFFWGGDALNQKTMRRIQNVARNATQTNFYGATETPQAMGFHTIEQLTEFETFPIGRGIDAVQLLLVTPEGKIAEFGELGEVWVRTPYLSNGYRGDQAQTSSKFTQNPFRTDPNDICYRTGDLGRYLTDGSVALAGRSDHQIKIRGFRVEPGEVLAAIEKIPGVARALVFAKDSHAGKVLVAYYSDDKAAANHSAPPTSSSVRDALRRDLPSYMVPTFIVSVETFPLLPNGKIDFGALPPPDRQDVPRSASYVPPETEQEKQLVALWQEVLRDDSVGVTDSFLDLGGDSLSALSVLVRMQQLGIPDHVGRGILQGKTIRQLVAGPGADDANEQLSPQAQSNLLVNVVRGVLVAIVITEHWLDGFLPDFLAKGSLLAPIFNLATPGFALVFGVSLGYGFYPKYLRSPAQTLRSLRIGGIVLAVSILVGGLVRLGVVPLRGTSIDSTSFFMAFLNALVYYAMAMATVPLWFAFISRFPSVRLGQGAKPLLVERATPQAPGNAYLGTLALIAIFVVTSQVVWRLIGHVEVSGFLYLCKTMLVAKFNYFKISSGALVGLMAGVALKSRVKMPLSVPTLAVGGGLIGLALLLLRVSDGNLVKIGEGDDMRLWRWIFCAGMVACIAAVAAAAIRLRQHRLPRTLSQFVGVVGQCSLPLFVLHVLVIDIHNILALVPMPEVLAVGLPMGAFFAFCAWMIRRLYSLYA